MKLPSMKCCVVSIIAFVVGVLTWPVIQILLKESEPLPVLSAGSTSMSSDELCPTWLKNEPTLAEFLRAVEAADCKSEWSYYDHHAVGRLASGLFWPEDEKDMCLEQTVRDAVELAAMLFADDYHSLELAWWQSEMPLMRIIILSVFYTQMNERICCFPSFSCHEFAPEVAAQRRREIQWVKQHNEELRPLFSRIIRATKQHYKEPSNQLAE